MGEKEIARIQIKNVEDEYKDASQGWEPIWNALLVLMKRKYKHSKIFVIATCQYDADCAKLDLLRHFDFKRRIPTSSQTIDLEHRRSQMLALAKENACYLSEDKLK